jgi:hypothetical protein
MARRGTSMNADKTQAIRRHGDSYNNNNNNNNNVYLLQLGCRPVAVVSLHVHEI